VDKFLISQIRSLARTMIILNTDTTSNKTDKFLNDNILERSELE